MGRRIPRLNEQLKREITGILRYEAKDPRIGSVTVTGVETTADLMEARVHVSVLGDDAEKRQSLEGLRAAAPFVRTELARRLDIRRVPALHFHLDRTAEHASRIERLLSEVAPPPPEGEAAPHDGGDADADEGPGDPGEEDGSGSR